MKKYKKIYDSLILRARQREKKENEYYEKHHVVPKCIGGSNDENNIVELTLREHFFAHRLLTYIYPNEKNIIFALWMITTMTLSSLKKRDVGELNNYPRLVNLMQDFNQKNWITSRDYETIKKLYVDTKKQKVYSEQERKNVSQGTLNGMKDEKIREKCRKGSLGCKYYYDKKTLETYKWFPGDKEIDLGRFSFGRPPMSESQKEKISKVQKLNKEYFIIPHLNLKYTFYSDFLKSVPDDWKKGWINKSTNFMRNSIVRAVQIFDAMTNYKYEKQIIKNVEGFSKNFKIITPSLFEFCWECLLQFEDEDFSEKLANDILKHIDEIIIANEKYFKK